MAIAELAREHDEFAAWLEALEGLEALTADPSYVALLQGDGMTDERFQAIVREVVSGIGERQMNLCRLLRRKARLALGGSIAAYFRELWDDQLGVARAEVRTAVEIDEQQRETIAQLLAEQTGKTVELEARVDPELLGGAVIRIGDRLIDGSTRRRLRELRERLAGSAR